MKLRPATPRPKFARLRNLKCFPEVKQKMMQGWTITALIDYIQKEQSEYTDVSAESLRTMLYDFRRTELTPAEKVTRTMPAQFMQAWKQIDKKLPELRELWLLYQWQKERIQIDLQTERRIKKLFATTGKEVQIAADLLDQSTQTKVDLGMVNRPAGQLAGDGQVDRVAVLQNTSVRIGLPAFERVGLNPEGRRRVLDLVDMMLRVGSRFDEPEGAIDAAKEVVSTEPVEVQTVPEPPTVAPDSSAAASESPAPQAPAEENKVSDTEG